MGFDNALSKRKIVHVDMDAFFASVEIKDKPELKGLPVVVGGSPNSRSVVCAASYEARKYGIHSAMACSKAVKLCPKAIFLPPRFSRYQEISKEIHQVFNKYTSLIEPVSLDEAWLDVTINHFNSPSATILAKQIKEDITFKTGLTCSAGVSFNKFLAKIASDEKKPNGLFVITPNNFSEFLHSIKVKKLPGVGKVTAEKLKKLNIEFGYQLIQQPLDFLIQNFGKFGQYLHNIIRGIDNSPVITYRERKSVGIENTFEADFFYGKRLKEELDFLLKGLFKRLKKASKRGKTITLKIKFEDFQQITRSITDDSFLFNDHLISKTLHQRLLESSLKDNPNKKIRLIGISVSNFYTNSQLDNLNHQLEIFNFIINKSGQNEPEIQQTI